MSNGCVQFIINSPESKHFRLLSHFTSQTRLNSLRLWLQWLVWKTGNFPWMFAGYLNVSLFFRHIAVFPSKLRILPQFIFNSRDPIVMGVIVEAGVLRTGTLLCVPTKGVRHVESAHFQLNSERSRTTLCPYCQFLHLNRLWEIWYCLH